jgi:3-oxoacyl-[acyl-carrier protein] reductase
MTLHNRIALVTGAAGAIGAATARALAAAGADVVVNHLGTPEAAEAVASEIRALGRRALAVDADIGDEAAVERLFAACDGGLGSLDTLVNAAGIARPEDIFETSLDSWNAVIRTNLTGPFLTCRAAMTRMRAKGRGRIVNLGSVVGHQGALKGHVHYGASKAGLHGLTRTLARTAAAHGITVNAVAPGIVDTPMLHATHGAGVADILARVPTGRLVSADAVAAAVVYLCSEAAAEITGAVLDINGGLLMR